MSNYLETESASGTAASGATVAAAPDGVPATVARFQSSFDRIAVGIAHTTVDGRILEVNRRLCEMLGYTAAELVGTTTRDLTHPDDRDRQDPLRQELLEDMRRQFSSDKRYLRRDGSVIWVSRTVALARDPAGGEPYLIQTIDSIDERKAAEERYRATFDNAPVGIMHTPIEGYRILRANRKLCDMLGYAPDELLRMSSSDVVHPDFRFSDADSYRRQMVGGGMQTYASERLFVRKDGTPVWVNRTISLVRDAAGNPDYFIRVIEDITARKQIDETMMRERALLRTIIDSVPEYIHVKDAQGRFLLANRMWLQARGMREDEIAGKTAFDFFSREVAEKMTAQDAELLRTGVPAPEWEQQIVLNSPRTPPEAARWAATVKVPMRDQSGRIIGTVGISRDITERKRSEATLREIEGRFRATFDSAPVGILHTGIHDNIILQANPKASEMLGYAREELLGIDIDSLVQPANAGSDRGKYRDQMLAGEMESYASEREYRRKDGSTLWVNRIISLARDDNGTPLYFIRIIEDITERVLFSNRMAMEHAVTQALGESAPLEAVMQQILRTICESLDWTCGSYWQWDAADQMLRCAESWDTGADAVREFIATSRDNPNEAPAWGESAPGTPSGGVVRRVWFSGAPAWFPDVLQQPDFRRGETAARAGLHSAFGFPILAGTRPLGVMEFYGHRIKQPDEALQIMVRSIGSQIGQFIQRKQAEDKLAFMARFDSITGLPNRFLFTDRLGQILTQAARNEWLVGLLFVDLDRFKVVNDTYGHAAGDRLLAQVAGRMSASVRTGDTVGRLSGDEFAVILSDLAKADDAALVAQKMVEALAAPYDLDGNQIHISASVGIALYPGDGETADALLKNADTAMYRAKEQGRNGYQFYLPQMNERLIHRQQLEAQLRGALDRDEFLLHYQPKVSLATGAITGFEALLRWQHGEKLVPPGDFIPIMEETGLIVAVGEWALQHVCAQIRLWEQAGLSPRPVAVNLSARQFQRKNLAETVDRVLRESGVSPALLKLELTESLLMSDAREAVETLHQLKQIGVQLSVDDFGTGYSSLAYLKRFPLDELKIDREFIRDAVVDPDDATIALTIINLAHSLKLRVVAEGVETEGQLAFLQQHGCDEIQGYYFSRPQPAAECSIMLREGRRLAQSQNTPKQAATLLLVVDHEHELELLVEAFTPAGYRIMTARNAEEGFEILARHRIDVVICDNDMPAMSGVEFLTRVRKMHADTLRVLASSGDDAPTLTRATNKAAIHLYLPKTWAAERLCAEVRDTLQAQVDAILSGNR